jgi:hypothetical protein
LGEPLRQSATQTSLPPLLPLALVPPPLLPPLLSLPLLKHLALQSDAPASGSPSLSQDWASEWRLQLSHPPEEP